MKVIPYGRQNIDDQDIQAVTDVLKADFLTQGPKIAEFEEAFAKYVSAKYAVAVSNATAGLHLSVLSLGLKKGERVITTPITFAASANCIRYCGGEVWFADIDPNTFLISYEKTKTLIESKPKGFFKGIIPVNLGGLTSDLEKFQELAKEHDLWIIEDACHSPGGYFNNSKGEIVKSGSAVYNEVSVFSFHPVKHIACGEGGMVTTNSEELYRELLLLRSHGISRENIKENHGGWYYEMLKLGFNYRLTDIQAALGISQLKKNKDGVIQRNRIAEKYKNAFDGKIEFQYNNSYYNAYHLFIILTDDRDSLYEYLKSLNIYCQIHYIPIYKFPYYNKINYPITEFNNSEEYYSRCLSLPMYPTLTEDDQGRVIEAIFKFYGWK